MSETIKILKDKNPINSIVIGPKTNDLLGRLIKLNQEERDNLLNETVDILSKCTNPIDNIDSKTGIAIGYVQSGKTMSFTTLTALALDNGFRIVVYFTGIKNNLLEQTTKRLKKDLLTDGNNSRDFKVYPNPTTSDNVHGKIQNALKLNHKPAILLPVLKHFKHIDELTRIFNSSEIKDELKNNGVLIIDDEADQASLNTYARKNSKTEDWEENEFSTTYASILNLKSSIPNHSYIQYTATPQGPLLINIMDLLSPSFHVVLSPGKTYTGGKTFFIDNPDLIVTIPSKEVYHHKRNKLSECPQSLVDAVQIFLIGVAINVNINKKENFLSMMVHADSQTDASKKFLNWVKDLISSWSERLDLENSDPSKMELLEEFKKNYIEAISRIGNAPQFDDVMIEVRQAILDTNLELVIQGSKDIDWSNASAHILVGADMLNRGYTVEGLMVTYMPRYSIGKSNADTIQQRCRFFGYKSNYLDSCRVFLPSESILEYREYVEHEQIMRTYLKEHTLQQIEQLLILSSLMNPTRNNILSKDLVRHKLNGWRQINALQHIEENISFVSEFLKQQKFKDFKDYGTPDRNHRYIKLEISKVIEFLKDFKIANMPDSLRKSSTIQYLRYLVDKKNIKHAYIIQMSFDVDMGRERSLIANDNKLTISNIFSGRSISGSETYPGDKGFCFEDSLCVQVHKIRLKHNSMKWDKKVIYTLGIYYPEDFAHSFVGIQN